MYQGSAIEQRARQQWCISLATARHTLISYTHQTINENPGSCHTRLRLVDDDDCCVCAFPGYRPSYRASLLRGAVFIPLFSNNIWHTLSLHFVLCSCCLHLLLPGPQKHVKQWPKTSKTNKADMLHTFGIQVQPMRLLGGHTRPRLQTEAVPYPQAFRS